MIVTINFVQLFLFRDMKNILIDRKNRIIMNIQKLNKIFEADNYSLSTQMNIIDLIIKYEYIFIVNAVD